MKVFLVLSLVVLGAASALVYTRTDVMTAFLFQASSRSEPAALLLSGGFLLGIAGAVRRFVSDPQATPVRNPAPLPQPRTGVVPCGDLQ